MGRSCLNLQLSHGTCWIFKLSEASEGHCERSDSGNGPVFPYARAWIAGVSRAGKRGAVALQVPTAGSNSFSYTSWLHGKRSDSIPSDDGSDTACGRYIYKKVHFSNTNIHSWISLQIFSASSYRLVCWMPTPEAQLRWPIQHFYYHFLHNT
jgi:hypothetical protein